mmetsp:Transcript_30518/g.98621  ORF Transcript_30518/g.98621 Transcript_30518/m.98621 type:complete len:254 (-) Transcript_30518:1777-2538(-)
MGIRRRGCGGRLHPHPGFTRRGGVGGRRRSAQDATACAAAQPARVSIFGRQLPQGHPSSAATRREWVRTSGAGDSLLCAALSPRGCGAGPCVETRGVGARGCRVLHRACARGSATNRGLRRQPSVGFKHTHRQPRGIARLRARRYRRGGRAAGGGVERWRRCGGGAAQGRAAYDVWIHPAHDFARKGLHAGGVVPDSHDRWSGWLHDRATSGSRRLGPDRHPARLPAHAEAVPPAGGGGGARADAQPQARNLR